MIFHIFLSLHSKNRWNWLPCYSTNLCKGNYKCYFNERIEVRCEDTNIYSFNYPHIHGVSLQVGTITNFVIIETTRSSKLIVFFLLVEMVKTTKQLSVPFKEKVGKCNFFIMKHPVYFSLNQMNNFSKQKWWY